MPACIFEQRLLRGAKPAETQTRAILPGGRRPDSGEDQVGNRNPLGRALPARKADTWHVLGTLPMLEIFN